MTERYRKPYTIYRRKTADGVTVFYFRTYDAAGRRTGGRSTGKTTEKAAREYCDKLNREGKLLASASPTLQQWVDREHWWEWGKCRYTQSLLDNAEKGKPAITRNYVEHARAILEARILPFHGSKHLGEITVKDCEALKDAWKSTGAAFKTINNWRAVYSTMLGEAERLEEIPRNPWDKVRPLSPRTKTRGLLTIDEARVLMNPGTIRKIWDKGTVYYLVNLTAMLTGMRQGEILALRQEDLSRDHIHVAHSWNVKFKIGPTKTKVEADVACPPQLYDMIHEALPWTGYVFSFNEGKSPCTGNRATEALYAAMIRAGISEEERLRRNITFHSWRRFSNTYFRGKGIPDALTRAQLRHKTEEMTEHYTGFQSADFAPVQSAQVDLLRLLAEPVTEDWLKPAR